MAAKKKSTAKRKRKAAKKRARKKSASKRKADDELTDDERKRLAKGMNSIASDLLGQVQDDGVDTCLDEKGVEEAAAQAKRRTMAQERLVEARRVQAAQRDEWREVKKVQLIAGLKKERSQTHVCEAVGVAFSTYKVWRKNDPEFDAACDEARKACVKDIVGSLERTAYKLATGYKKPVTHNGEITDWYEAYDMGALKMLLQRHDAAYADRQQVTSTVDAKVEQRASMADMMKGMSDEERKLMKEMLQRRIAAESTGDDDEG